MFLCIYNSSTSSCKVPFYLTVKTDYYMKSRTDVTSCGYLWLCMHQNEGQNHNLKGSKVHIFGNNGKAKCSLCLTKYHVMKTHPLLTNQN